MLLHDNPGNSCCDDSVHNHQYTGNSNPCIYFCRINHPQDCCFPECRGVGRVDGTLHVPSHYGNGKFINLILSFWMRRSVGAAIDYAGDETESCMGNGMSQKHFPGMTGQKV